jgi:hypothetical protein
MELQIQSRFFATSFICSILKGQLSNPVASSLHKVPNCVGPTSERGEGETGEKFQSGKFLFFPALNVESFNMLLLFLLLLFFFFSFFFIPSFHLGLQRVKQSLILCQICQLQNGILNYSSMNNKTELDGVCLKVMYHRISNYDLLECIIYL